jgi:hypothetical protein
LALEKHGEIHGYGKTLPDDKFRRKKEPIELVGFPMFYAGGAQIWVVDEEGGTNNYIIDSATIEPLAKKVENQRIGSVYNQDILVANCPNCNGTVTSYPQEIADNGYCSRCGQRIEWAE